MRQLSSDSSVLTANVKKHMPVTTRHGFDLPPSLPPGRHPKCHLFFVVVVALSFVTLFWPPGRPKMSIVANLAPTTTPKRSPKSIKIHPRWNSENWSHSLAIASFLPSQTPSWELLFRSFFRVGENVTKNRLRDSLFRNFVLKWRQRDPQKEAQRWPKSHFREPWATLALKWRPRPPPPTSKSYQNFPKTSKNQPNFDEYVGCVQILLLTLKTNKQLRAFRPVFYLCFEPGNQAEYSCYF